MTCTAIENPRFSRLTATLRLSGVMIFSGISGVRPAAHHPRAWALRMGVIWGQRGGDGPLPKPGVRMAITFCDGNWQRGRHVLLTKAEHGLTAIAGSEVFPRDKVSDASVFPVMSGRSIDGKTRRIVVHRFSALVLRTMYEVCQLTLSHLRAKFNRPSP